MAVGGVDDEDDQQPDDSDVEEWEDVSDDEDKAKVKKMDVDKADEQLWQRHDWLQANVCTADKSSALAMVTVLVMVVMRTNITNTRH